MILKPNIGGSGAKIVRFDSVAALRSGMKSGTLDLGIDGIALIQEYLSAAENSIVRVEVLNGTFLYAIRLFLTRDEFNLCPADYCRVPGVDASAGRQGLADGVSGRGLHVEGYFPPRRIIEDVLRITAASQIEVGGVEYLINQSDGEVYFYDVNALSNFVANAPTVIGFDPFPRLVDFVLQRARLLSAAGIVAVAG